MLLTTGAVYYRGCILHTTGNSHYRFCIVKVRILNVLQVPHTTCIAHYRYCIPQGLHYTSTAYYRLCILHVLQVLHTTCSAYFRYYISKVLHTTCTRGTAYYVYIIRTFIGKTEAVVVVAVVEKAVVVGNKLKVFIYNAYMVLQAALFISVFEAHRPTETSRN